MEDQRKKYDRTFKENAIKLSYERKNVSELSRELGITASKGMIFHSDRGILYACKMTANYLRSFDFTRSMSRKGNPWDNAVSESFFKTLKSELVYGQKRLSKEEIRTAVFQYIEIWYNHQRRQSYLEYLTIDEFWKQYYMNKYLNKVAA